MNLDGVSIVICCYNSSEVIVPTIESINKLIIPDDESNIELIVVDNNCSDNTVELVNKTFDNQIINLQIVTEHKPGLMNARKKGVESSSGDIVVFVDDDNILNSNYIQKVFDIFKLNESIGVIGGQVIPKVTNYPSWFTKYLGVYACGMVADKSMDVTLKRMTLFGAGLSFRSEVIKKILVENFDNLVLMGRTENTLLRGDDSELCMQAILNGWHVWYQDDLTLEHNILERRINWEYVKKARFGGGMASIVLDMYRFEVLNKSVDSYFINFSKSLVKLLKFIFSTKFKKRDSEGSHESFEYYALKGRVYAFVKVFPPKRYNKVKNYIKGLKK